MSKPSEATRFLTSQFHTFLGSHPWSARRVLEPALLIKTFGSQPPLASLQFLSLIAPRAHREAPACCVWPERRSVFQSPAHTCRSRAAKRAQGHSAPSSVLFLPGTYMCFVGITSESVALFKGRLHTIYFSENVTRQRPLVVSLHLSVFHLF